MRPVFLFSLLVIILIQCQTSFNLDIQGYHDFVNRAELQICNGDHNTASLLYDSAFVLIDKPFGKDIFNAALCYSKTGNKNKAHALLQKLINNSDALSRVEQTFIPKYISAEDWQSLLDRREVEYDADLRSEMREIRDRDQKFRPLYSTHNDSITANLKMNMARIMELTQTSGFPGQQELGYTRNLREQDHHIVLHHQAQRRSRDKEVEDLEPVLWQAVNDGKLDPETAIFYMNLQNDTEKGRFQVYSTWQYKHAFLPDSLNNKIWMPRLSEAQRNEANEMRRKWLADELGQIAVKTKFNNQDRDGFIFTSVRKSVGNFPDNFDPDKALEQYRMRTGFMVEYKD